MAGLSDGSRQASLSKPSWSAQADHPRVCQPSIQCLPVMPTTPSIWSRKSESAWRKKF